MYIYLLVSIIIIFLVYKYIMPTKKDKIIAIASLTNVTVRGLKGYIEFEEDLKTNEVIIKLHIDGLPRGKHAFHIHQAGDLTDSCASACSHFNPTGKTHGGPKSKVRHVGDLGNIQNGKNGNVRTRFRDKVIKLRGKNNIVGRSIVIHEGPDDFGVGGLDKHGNVVDKKEHAESLKTGNAGSRIACGVIGYSKKMFKC